MDNVTGANHIVLKTRMANIAMNVIATTNETHNDVAGTMDAMDAETTTISQWQMPARVENAVSMAMGMIIKQ